MAASARWAAALALGALVVVVLHPHFFVPPTADVSWLLHAAGRLADGGTLGHDVVEVNPPLILWLKIPVVLAARALDVMPYLVWMGAIAVLAVVVAWWTARLLGDLPGWGERRAAAACVVMLLMTLAVPRYDFGQREHLAFLLTVPLLAVAMRRSEGVPTPAASAAAAGAVGALGLCVKPYFLLVAIALLAVALRRDRHAWRRPEFLAIGAVGVAYTVAVLVAAPAWLALARTFAGPYSRYLSGSLWFTALLGEGAWLCWLGLLAWVAARRHAGIHRPAVDTLAIAMVAFFAGAVLQRKGWRYQFLPGMLCMALFVPLLAANVRHVSTFARRLVLAGAVVASTLLLALGVYDGVNTTLMRPVWRPDLDGNLPALAGEVRKAGPRPTVAVITSNVAMAFPLVEVTGARWWSRHPSIWALQLDDLTVPDARGIRRCRAPGERRGVAGIFLDGMREDMRATSPDVLILPQPDATVRGWGGALRVDYMECLRREPGMDRWLASYHPVSRVGPYVVYRPRELAGRRP
jgi:hypothetical protein